MFANFASTVTADLSSYAMSFEHLRVVFSAPFPDRINTFSGVASSWKNADTVVVDLNIDSPESAAGFATGVEAMTAMIKSHNPNSQVVWLEGFTCDTPGSLGSLPVIQQRWLDNNATLAQLLSQHKIDGVVSWRHLAEASHVADANFYESDCTRMTTADTYSERIAGLLDQLGG